MSRGGKCQKEKAYIGPTWTKTSAQRTFCLGSLLVKVNVHLVAGWKNVQDKASGHLNQKRPSYGGRSGRLPP